MDSAEIWVISGGFALIGLTLWFFFGAKTEKSLTKTAAGKPIYECPMHSWITSVDAAASCSICGMKLVRRGDASIEAAATK